MGDRKLMTKDDARRLVWELIEEQIGGMVADELECWEAGTRRGIYPDGPTDDDVEKLRAAGERVRQEAMRRIGRGSFASFRKEGGEDG